MKYIFKTLFWIMLLMVSPVFVLFPIIFVLILGIPVNQLNNTFILWLNAFSWLILLIVAAKKVIK